ncbi:MAG: ribosome maturation factor RimM [Promethearchaeota archaeon]
MGRVVAPHGIRGEVKVAVLTEDPSRFELLTQVYLGDEAASRPYALEGWRLHKGHVLLRLAGVTDRNAAEVLRGQWVLIPVAEALPLEPGEFYVCQLVDLEAQTTSGESLGRVTDVLSAGENDVLVIQGPRGEVLIPFTAEVVPIVDLEAGRLTIEPLEGLL